MPILRNPLQGIADGIRNMLAELLGSSQFFAPLTHSLVLARGTGSPTFTRASTATFTDWEGVLRTVPSGCARFEGARMVQNLWTTSSATLANGANKSLTLATGDYTFSMGAGTGTATFSGTGGATGTLAASASGRVEVTKTITAGTFVVTASVADLVDLQVEYVTGQADQTASEYVSVGVVQRNVLLNSNSFIAPYWTATACGVTANATDGVEGLQASKLVPASTGVARGIYQTAAKPVLSFYAKAGEFDWVFAYNVGGSFGAAWYNVSTGTLGTVIAGYTASIILDDNGFYRCTLIKDDLANFAFLQVGVADADNSETATASGSNGLYFCATQAESGSAVTEYQDVGSSYIYHGAGVDGVEFFNTDRDGAVIPAATNTGYLAETADVLAYPTASNILAAASTVYLEFTPDHTPSGTIALWGTYVDASNYTAILHDATNMIMRKRIAGVNYDATIANAFSANTTYKVCGSWGASGATVTVDGTEGTPHANTTAAQIAATMQWGADGNSLQQPFATERNARVWQRQLSASERGAVTS